MYTPVTAHVWESPPEIYAIASATLPRLRLGTGIRTATAHADAVVRRAVGVCIDAVTVDAVESRAPVGVTLNSAD
jgi:hypothetical protein